MLTTDSIFGGAKATQEADNVLLLQEERSAQSFFKKKSIQVGGLSVYSYFSTVL